MPDVARRAKVTTSAGLALIAWVAGCAGPSTVAPRALRPLSAESAAFLPDPSTLAVGADVARLAAWHRRLLAGESTSALRAEVENVVTGAPSAAVVLFLAEVDLVDGLPAQARDRLDAAALEIGSSPTAMAVAGRAAELSGDPLAAWIAYGRAADRDAPAARRKALAAEAKSAAARALADDLRRGRVEDAAAMLDVLDQLAPFEPATLEAKARVAYLRGDAAAELAALKALGRGPGAEVVLATEVRIAELEVEAGNASTGLAQLEALAAAHPDDAGVREALVRSRFLFRLVNSPDGVRHLAARPQLTRADYAVLLYWLVPGVRSSRSGTAQIATDILDQEASEEIVRVANLGLLRVDPAMHRFDPERPLRRSEAFLAMARVRSAAADSTADGCSFAAAMGWFTEPAECLPGGPVSGAQAVDWIRDATASEESR